MPFEVLQNVEAIEPIVAGAPSTTKLPQNLMKQLEEFYWEIRKGAPASDNPESNLASKEQIIADVEKLEMIVNYGSVTFLDTVDAFMLEAFNGYDFVPGELPWRFVERNRLQVTGQERNCLILGAYPIIQTRLYLRDSASDLSYRQYLHQRDIRRETANALDNSKFNAASVSRQIVVYKKLNVPIDQVGKNNFVYKTDAQAIKALHLMGDSAKSVKVFINGQPRFAFEHISQLNRLIQKSYVPQDGIWHIMPEAFTRTWNEGWAVNEDDEIKLEIHTDNTNNLDLLVEEYKFLPHETDNNVVAQAYSKSLSSRNLAS